MKDTDYIDTSIVIPSFNEESSIMQVISDVHKAMEQTNHSYEILVVDDCSTDNTIEKIKDRNDIRLIKHKFNQGSGASRRTGIKEAKGEIVVMIDADGTYPAKEIPELLKYFPEYDQVNGARNEESGDLKIFRSLAKGFIKSLASFLTKEKIPDLNTGLKAFKKSIALKYLWALPDGFSCVSTLTLSFLCNGYSVKYIPIDYYPRKNSKSKFHPIKDTYSYLVTVIRMVSYFQPIKIFLPLSLMLFIFGVVKTLIDYNMIQRMQLSDIVIFMASFIVFCLGILADLIVAQAKRIGGINEKILKELVEEMNENKTNYEKEKIGR